MTFGKKHSRRKCDNKFVGWTKKSIFFGLLYWKTLLLSHNLNVMMNTPGKTKDHIKSRFDLQDISSRKELHLVKEGDVYKVSPVGNTLTLKEKCILC